MTMARDYKVNISSGELLMFANGGSRRQTAFDETSHFVYFHAGDH